jgi:hypothetical protein
MQRKLLLGLLVGVLLILTACGAPLPAGESGQIALKPFISEELGLRGLAPWNCDEVDLGTFYCPSLSPDESPVIVIQQSFPGMLDELAPLLLESVSLEELPEISGRYRGKIFDWGFFTFESQIRDLGPEKYRIDLAWAEDGSTSYFVALLTMPDAYEANEALYETVFTHALYALAPLP